MLAGAVVRWHTAWIKLDAGEPSRSLRAMLGCGAMTVQEYLHLADTCLARVATWLEDFDPDEVDFSTTDGMVSIEFPARPASS